MVSLLQLRKNEPGMIRPFKVPLYPVFPVIALIIAAVSFIAMTIFNLELVIIYIVILGICFGAFKIFKK
jgi:ethanolamine permease